MKIMHLLEGLSFVFLVGSEVSLKYLFGWFL